MSVTATGIVAAKKASFAASLGHISPSTLAVAGYAIAMPAIVPPLRTVSETAAQLAPIFGLVLVVLKIWSVISGRERGEKVAEHGEKAVGMLPRVGAAFARLGRGGLFVAIGGILALVIGAVMLRPREAAAVQPVVSQAPRKRRTADDAGEDGQGSAGLDRMAPKWLISAHADLGTREWRGKRHNPKILAYFRDAGTPEITDDETSWCAAFVGAHLARAGYPAPGDARARAFLQWGQPIETPDVGAIVVFWRESPQSWKGHVGIVMRENGDGTLDVLGGNQGDAVSVARFPVSRVLGYRWPRKASESRTARAGALAVATETTGVGMQTASAHIDGALDPTSAADAVAKVQGPLRELSAMFRWAGIAASVLGLMLGAYVVWRRYQDWKQRGI